jgi:hypothetical protein
MKKFSLFAAIVLMFGIFLTGGCTANQSARSYGGSMTIHLPPGQKFLSANWKEANLWYQFRPMRSGEKAEAVTFKESSQYGLVEGTVVFQEHE